MTARALSRGLAALATLAVAALAQAAAAAPAASSPAARPLRIVTLLPSLTESVCALGDCDRLVGVDRYSDWPERVRTLPALGGQDDAQVERIVALRPDLVLASPSTRAVDRLRSLGLRVVALEARDTAQTHQVLEAVARSLGRPGEGDALWRRLDARVASAAARVPAGWHHARVYIEVGSEPYAAGAASFIGELLARLGLDNIVPASLGPFPQINPEYVVRAQPALIIAEDRELASMASRPGWSALHALQRHAVCAFPPAAWEPLIRPGPRLADAAERVADCLAALPVPAPAVAPAPEAPRGPSAAR
jgi:iron complex transport system substrate-binding protein